MYPMTSCAYVTLVMKGDLYTAGALVLGNSLRRTGSVHTTLSMITEDVSPEAERCLKGAFDRVLRVPYLTFHAGPMPNKITHLRYGYWATQCLTQHQCLRLVEYEKVCFLDSDVVVLRNMDCIFDLETPAATFEPLIGAKRHGETITPEEVSNTFVKPYHGFLIQENQVNALLQSDSPYTCMGNYLLLRPDAEVYADFLLFLEREKPFSMGSRLSLPNERLIATFFSNSSWRFVSSSFQHCTWHAPDPKMMPAFLYHYVERDKPWETHRPSDWWTYACVTPQTAHFFDIKRNQRLRKRLRNAEQQKFIQK